MRIGTAALLCLLLFPAIATSQPPAAPGDGLPSPPPSIYCRLLHLSTGPAKSSKPRPYLGIAFSGKKLERPYYSCPDGDFIQVDRVIGGSPAAAAGIRENDVITSLNGTPLCREKGEITAAFRAAMEGQGIGAPVTMEILRATGPLSVTARLVELPTRHQPQADHRQIEKCPDGPSLFETALRSRNALSLFGDILAGLDLRSRAVLNPDLPPDKNPDNLQSPELAWILRHPLSAGEVAAELTQRLILPPGDDGPRLNDTLRHALRLLDAEPAADRPPREVTFPALLQAMEEAKVRVESAMGGLSPAEAVFLRENALCAPEDDCWNRVVDLSLRVDRRKLFAAFTPLLPFFARDNLVLLKADLLKRFGDREGPILYEAVTPIGRVIVGGTGPNVYREDAALILDLGGDDLYLNNAGGSRPGMPVALVIDWGGDDRYVARDSFSQGAGILGGGFLLDLGGNDTFVARDGSQGSGFWGMGLLYHGDGRGAFDARSFSQGTGEMGVGLMVNGKGDTVYHCSLGGQGLGLFGGAGILLDRGGDDYYQLGGLRADFRDPQKATISLGQGFGEGYRAETGKTGVPGGIGILVDEGGDDTYVADYFAQGAAYYYGLGILHDLSGNDRYIAGRYAQGAGIHSAAGVLLDRQGNDAYYASFGVAQGMGHDFGVGYLEDDQGDDTYWGGQLVQGAATNGGLGFLLDLKGSDRYTCSGMGQAYSDAEDGMGVMIDTEPAKDILSNHRDVAPVRVGVKNPGK